MIFDDPNEIKEHGRTVTMTEGFYRRIGRIESELLIEVPYFVVRETGARGCEEYARPGCPYPGANQLPGLQ